MTWVKRKPMEFKENNFVFDEKAVENNSESDDPNFEGESVTDDEN